MKILKESSPDWLYMQLHMFKRGLIGEKELEGADDLIFNVKPNGIVSLRFTPDEKYFKLFDLHQDDIWFLNNLFSTYSGLELYDGYRARDDWDEGYIIRYFSDSNMELCEELKRIISPNLDLESNEGKTEFSKILNDLFHNRVDYIIGDYESEMDSAIKSTMEKEIIEELCEIFNEDGIHNSNGCFYGYVTTVDNLIKLYDRFNLKSATLETLLKELGHSKSIDGNYYENVYEYMYRVNFDEESFNKSVKWNLEQIISDLEDSDKFINIDEYKEIISYLHKRFKFNAWYKRPKDADKIMFKILRVNPENNEIEVEYKKINTMDFKKGSYDLEHFNNFLYHPELFD